jgi:hypothetical protein
MELNFTNYSGRYMRPCVVLMTMVVLLLGLPVALVAQPTQSTAKSVLDSAKIRFQENTHPVVLDDQGKIIPWTTPQSKAYDVFLHRRWDFIKHHVPASPGPAPRSLYPQYYFYCAYRPKNGELVPDTWMNDIGEKIPNWFESARLYYAYTGDNSVMEIVETFMEYVLTHGTTPSSFSWPNFPHTTTNAGDTVYQGFTSAKRFAMHEIQVDHASEMGLAYYRLFQYTGKEKYKTAAVNVANTLAKKVRPGSATQSPWPYLVIMDNGKITSEYGANWTGAYTLLNALAEAKIGNVDAYKKACKYVKDFILNHPMQTGYWTDGHSDNSVTSNTYRSNLSASNFKLFMFDFPEFNPNWKRDIPKLIEWTEKWFIERGAPSEPGNMWGANIVGEQDDFLFKMDYQTARYAAECARWYAISGDEAYKEKAYRALNWVTYCSDENGMAFESPLSKGISTWWSDCYGEGPRMFYHAFAGIPEWAPPGEDHILYSEGVLKDVSYANKKIQYTATDDGGIDFLRLSFTPATISVNGAKVSLQKDKTKEGYTVRSLGNGDYAVQIKRSKAGRVVIGG